ncbi:RNA polymerase sigma factor [Demequina capsici]|uniref:RNA polymerase sigma factor n=1 Tax=Demequina capsici TaxID=3075620 RepID=A0AA96FBL4_9MICO|nr:RNA polymerase sigma factor [Demequina sp. PMTSA13]WNM27264.1 RNA polymerase sigma factor [Demequina sp. PMTSA13]
MRELQASDASEWASACAGDGGALGILFDRHSPRVFRHALRLLSHRQDAEDATAAAFLELWRKRGQVRLVRESVLPWLLVATTNLSRNMARSTRRYRALLDALPRSETSPSAADVLAAVPSDVLEHIDPELAAAIRRLPKASAALLALTALEGMSTVDAAQAMGMSPAAARTRLSRARAQVRASLGESALDDELKEVRHG